jgi:hypothetical protein
MLRGQKNAQLETRVFETPGCLSDSCVGSVGVFATLCCVDFGMRLRACVRRGVEIVRRVPCVYVQQDNIT